MILLELKPNLLLLIIIALLAKLTSNTELNLTKTEFTKCVQLFGFEPFPENTYELFVETIKQIGGITTKLEALMAVTQFSWESGGFNAKASWLCSQAYEKQEYFPANSEYAKCLKYDKKGCPEDKVYYGRGYAQITHCYNYRNASIDLYGSDILVRQPELVATNNTIAMDTAIWFWKNKIHNYPGVSDGYFGSTTDALIGDLECGQQSNGTVTAKKRWERFKNCLEVVKYDGNDYSERGCYPLDTSREQHDANPLVAIIVCVIIALVIIMVTFVALRYYRLNSRPNLTQQTPTDDQTYDYTDNNNHYEVVSKNVEYDQCTTNV